MTPTQLIESRLALGLSQKQLANILGFGKGGNTQIGIYENGRAKPNKRYLNQYRLLIESYELKKTIIQLKAELETLKLKIN